MFFIKNIFFFLGAKVEIIYNRCFRAQRIFYVFLIILDSGQAR